MPGPRYILIRLELSSSTGPGIWEINYCGLCFDMQRKKKRIGKEKRKKKSKRILKLDIPAPRDATANYNPKIPISIWTLETIQYTLPTIVSLPIRLSIETKRLSPAWPYSCISALSVKLAAFLSSNSVCTEYSSCRRILSKRKHAHAS